MRKGTRRIRAVAAALTGMALISGLTSACSDGGGRAGPARPDNRITVWTLENLPARMSAQRKMAAHFERRSGVRVKLVGVDEAQLPQLVMSAAAAGHLPDVIAALPLGQTWQMYGNGLLNTELPRKIVHRLDARTFTGNALKLTADERGDGHRLAVPSDAWLQLLVYRKDLLKKAHLPSPDTYARLLKAARTLDTGRRDGVAMATDPGDVFTQQSFEDLALANDCRLVDGGRVSLDSPACRRSFAAYRTLARDHGAAGTQTLDSTRATYFAGRSPILLWSSFLLDELSGERADARPSCPRCAKDRGYLAKHSGIATTLRGPDGKKPAQFGEITSWAVTKTAETGASRRFIEYMMGPGYRDWFGMAPEGKIPVRRGTADDPDAYVRAWRSSRLGVEAEHRRRLNDIYDDRLLDQLLGGVRHMRRWGIAQGEGALVGATNGELPVPKSVGAMTSGDTPPSEAARTADEEVDALRRSLQ